MSATQVNFRRGTSSQMASFIGSTGEITVDTTNNRIVVHDSVTPGGWTGAKLSDINDNISNISGILKYNNPNIFINNLNPKYSSSSGIIVPSGTHGSCFASGYIFGTTISPSGEIYRVDPNNFTNYISTILSVGVIADITYCSTNNKLYAIAGNGNVLQIDPATMSISTVITPSPSWPTNAHTITNDGTYLYVIYNGYAQLAGGPTYSFNKYLISDFSFVNGIAFTLATSIGQGHSSQYNDGYVYFTTQQSPAKLIKVKTNDLSYSYITLSFNTATDDFALLGDYIYIGSESSNNISRINKNTFNIDLINVGNPSYGVVCANNFIWNCNNNEKSITRINPSTLDCVKYNTPNQTGVPNEIIWDGDRLYVTFYSGVGNASVGQEMFRFDINNITTSGKNFKVNLNNNQIIDYTKNILSGNWIIDSGYVNGILNLNNNQSTTNLTLSNKPIYINNSLSQVNWILPSISQSTGINYFIKNKGNNIILSGNYPDLIYYQYPVINFTISSGEAYQLFNDGYHWNIM